MILSLLGIATEVSWDIGKWTAKKVYGLLYYMYYKQYPGITNLDNEQLNKKIEMLEYKIDQLEKEKNHDNDLEKI